ncbi:MAG: hypothetical protein KGM15_12605 [Pseudomonadota bacterium]|nr:hypothetical protein [Pseudomonadota bacterium]
MADYDPYTPDDAPAPPYDEESPAPKLRRARRRRRRGGVLWFVMAFAAVIVTLALAAGFGVAYLGRGPISLESWQPAIAASLQSRLKPGYKVALGPTAISRGAHGVGIGFSRLSVRDPQGRVVVNAPGGRISLDAFALLGLQVKVRRLELDGLQLALRVGADGELSVAAGEGEATPIPLGATPAAPASNNFGALVAELAQAMAGADQPLDHLAIVDGRLTVQTAGRVLPAVYDRLRLSFDRAGAAATASFAAVGPSGELSLTASAESGPKRKLAFSAKDLAVDDFLRLNPNPPQFSFDSPVSLQFAAESSPSGALSALDGDFSLGAGKFDPHDPDGAPPIAIDEATGKFTLDAERRYRLDKMEVLSGATHVRFDGLLSPPAPTDPLWRLQLHSRDIVFTGAGAGDPAAKLDEAELDAHIDPAAKTFDLERFSLRGPHLSGEIGVHVKITDAGPEVKLDLAGAGALREALRLWPTFVNPDARTWCVDNIRGGDLASGSLKVDWDAPAFAAVMARQAAPAESVDGRFTLRNAAVNLLPGLPTTTGLDAVGEITGRRFHVAAARGVMELASGRRLAGADLSFTVPDTAPMARMPAMGAGHITGSADALADLLTQEALKRYVGVALDPATIKGQFQGDLKLNLTLGKGVQPEEQKFSAVGALAGLSIDKFLGNARLEQGALDVVADSAQIKMTGAGQLFGSPARLDLLKVGQDVGAITISGVLDEAARAKLGYNSGPRIRGPVAVKFKAPLDKSGAEVELDLAKATLDSLGGPPWKPAGRPGKASFQLKAAGESVQVANLVIDAGSLSGKGSALFGPEGALKSLKLAPFKMSASDDLRLDLDGGEHAKLTLRGGALDARNFVKGLTGGEAGVRDDRTLDLDIKVGAALGYNKEQITGFEMTAVRRNGGFASLDARGKVGQNPLLAHGGEPGVINLKSEDAGALARFLDVYGKLEGGAIDLTMRQTGDIARGNATIKHFTIRDEPSLHKLEQSAPAQQNTSRGQNPLFGSDPSPPVRFDRLTANFTRVGGKLDVRDGVVSNGSFGLTTQGFIDFAKDKVDLSGVYVPLYQFNNAFGKIPLLGALLTGGQNEGIFAINYRVSGAASKPTLNINPLSGITPGFLRKVFGAIDGTAPTPDPDLPAASYAPTPPR